MNMKDERVIMVPFDIASSSVGRCVPARELVYVSSIYVAYCFASFSLYESCVVCFFTVHVIYCYAHLGRVMSKISTHDT